MIREVRSRRTRPSVQVSADLQSTRRRRGALPLVAPGVFSRQIAVLTVLVLVWVLGLPPSAVARDMRSLPHVDHVTWYYVWVWNTRPMAAITEVGAGVTASDQGTAITTGVHGVSIAANDVIIISVGTDASDQVVTDNNAGFNFTNAWSRTHPDAASTWYIWTWIATASEPTSYNFTLGSPQEWSLIMRVFRGVDVSGGAAGIWDVAPSDGTTWTHASDSADPTAESVSITIATAGALGMILIHTDSAGVVYSSPSNGYGTQVSVTNRPATAWAIQTWSSPGATGTATLTNVDADDFMMHHVALKPATAVAVRIPPFPSFRRIWA